MGELWAHLRSQPFDEWIVLLNGAAQEGDLPQGIFSDPRVAVCHYQGKTTNIGEIKHEACMRTTGDVIIELDHDDILVGGAVKATRGAFADDEIVFVYSDAWRFMDDGGLPRAFRKDYGWEDHEATIGGRRFRVAVTPEPTAYHVSLIWFAPDHMRAWRRSTYVEVAGHDPALKVCDDLDLMCKLFMKGRFKKLPGDGTESCYYQYRIHGENSWLKNSDEIQRVQRQLQWKYLRPMIEAETEKEIRLDLGGRIGSPDGYRSVDLKNADEIVDLEGPWPWDNSSIGVIRASDALEHLVDPIHTMSEIHRVLRPGGYLVSDTPSTCGPDGKAGQGAFQDPTHISFWNANSFWYYTREAQARFIDNTMTTFLPVIVTNYYPSQWHIKNMIPYVRADLVAVKDGYRPHGPFWTAKG